MIRKPNLPSGFAVPLASLLVAFLALIAVVAPSLVIVDAAPPEQLIDAASVTAAMRPPPPLTAYASIVARPLFNAGRSKDPPPPPPEPPKPPPPPSVDNYRLVGLVLSPTTRLALVERREGGQDMRLMPGDLLDGWTVVSVEASGVRLTGPGVSAQLTIPHAEPVTRSSPPTSTSTLSRQSAN
jgi:hypothetical protein